jgi:4'-phosphopantetheinyl transferase
MTPAEVQLWSIDIDPANHEPAELLSLLSGDEKDRAKKFRFEKHRHRWIASRAMLRVILSEITRQTPESIIFKYGENDKPHIDCDEGQTCWHFNLTHSADIALVAVTSIGPVGIDVEKVQPLSDVDAVVKRFFSLVEQDVFGELNDDDRLNAFYSCWTRKEAYLKALGCGISSPTDKFDVAFLPNSEPQILAIDGDKSAARDWILFDLAVAPEYVGALAIRSKNDIDLIWRDSPIIPR